MRHIAKTSLLLITAIAAIGCGKGACEELQDKQCDCHDELCEIAESQDTNKEDEEVCEEGLRDWDCEEAMDAAGLERFNALD
tara:strand:+ start:196 stop:441 length:246 start_codon:yes stop_codon:yes gene_type:complete